MSKIYLPNFLPSTLPVATSVVISRFWPDMVYAYLSVVMLALLVLCGVADLVAGHFRARLKTLNLWRDD